jgi:predicted MFS family arabinose efflux permease
MQKGDKMSKKNKPMKAFLPPLGIVFGTAIGVVISVIWNFKIAFCIIFGAAIGLLVGIVALNLFYKNKPSSGNEE